MLRRNIDLNAKKRILACYVFCFQLWLQNIDLFQDGSKKDTNVRNVVLQETSQDPMDRKEKQQRNYTNGQCRRKTVQQLMKRKLGYAGYIIRGSSGPLLQLSLGEKMKGREDREEWRDMVANFRTEYDT
ncbi:hypothetical protein ElyMa_006125300 [Elysia marginata]|uniref:Uncharacterized protein n=1 Tax=Elysia marginata TaxID=1093978 RepID=A0AAV4GVN4_9GAST|nr:hypothetical protein ElyMa_006125300 [Elysia marginata]